MARICIVLDSPGGALRPLGEAVARLGAGEWEVHTLRRAADVQPFLESHTSCGLIIADFFEGDGRRKKTLLMDLLRAAAPKIPLIAAAAKGDVKTAAQAVTAGATDFLVRTEPIDERVRTLLAKLTPTVQLIEENRELREQNERFDEAFRQRHLLIGNSPPMRELTRRVRRVAKIPRPVLITGERGTGKELIARAIHSASDRASRPLITVNCAAFTDTLLESELFGHERGAFTGADRIARGKFELADGGTLFLDEIGNMSLSFQQKILRVVEYGVFMRLGGQAELRASARLVAATNVDLKERISTGQFLPDLYDRLSFEVIHVPPLRERSGDIELLAQFFLQRFMLEIPAFMGKVLSREALDTLRQYSFPGNVRELKNIIERAAYRDSTNEITSEDIGPLDSMGSEAPNLGAGFDESVREHKRRLIEEALRASGGNQAEAARKLGLAYHQFRYHFAQTNTKRVKP